MTPVADVAATTRAVHGRIAAVAVAAALSFGGANAQEVTDCDWRAQASNLMEPWEENTRTFGGGRTRVAALDTIEPAAGAFHLLIISPPFDELGGRQCKIVSKTAGIGFAGMRIDRLTSSYNPATGLALQIPVLDMGADGTPDEAVLEVSINQGSGEISAGLGAQ